MKKQPKLTDWIDGDIKPIRPGIYERDDTDTFMEDGRPNYSRWTGKQWLASEITVDTAARVDHLSPSIEQNLPWRGLAEDPAKVKE